MKRTDQKIPYIISGFKMLWFCDFLSHFAWLVKTQGKVSYMLEAHMGQRQAWLGMDSGKGWDCG